MINITHNFSLMNVRIKYKLLEFDRMYISEGIDIDKTSKSKEWQFAIIGSF